MQDSPDAVIQLLFKKTRTPLLIYNENWCLSDSNVAAREFLPFSHSTLSDSSLHQLLNIDPTQLQMGWNYAMTELVENDSLPRRCELLIFVGQKLHLVIFQTIGTSELPIIEKMDLLTRDLLNAKRTIEEQNYDLMQTKNELASRVEELTAILKNLKKLEGLIPICSLCKRIRDDNDAWYQLESFISSHSEAVLSHGICPRCSEKTLSSQ